MAYKSIILAAVLAVANAGYLGSPAISYAAPAYAPAAITSQHSNILRTPGNLGQVSTYSKTIDTPYSSVSKSDVRVSNDALAYGAVPAYSSYAAPAIHGAYAAPAIHGAYAAPAYASAAYAPAAITSQHSNILRTPGNLGQVSTYSKTIDTPYSSVSKSDVRVSNDALAYGAVPAYSSYAAPAIHGAYAAPAYASAAYAPAAITSQHSNILRTPGNLGQVSTYSKTIDTPYSSVSKSDVRVSNDALAYGAVPAYSSYAAPAIHGAYAAPAIHGAYAAPVVKTTATAVSGHGLLGVAYSAAPVVSHMTYSNAYGLHYAY